jgi:antitoxin ParD1/3/4
MPLNINLTDRLEAMVRKKVADGLYNNASEVIREALRLMEAQDRLQSAQIDGAKLAALQAALTDGVSSGPDGVLDIASIKTSARARLS